MTDDNKRAATRDPEIIQYEDGSYYYRGSPPGIKKRVERSLKTKSFSEAKIKKAVLVEMLSRTGLEADRLIVGNMITDYLKDREAEFLLGEIRLTTIREDRLIIGKHLRPYFFKYKLNEIDEDLFLSYCRFKGKKDMTNHRKIMSKFFRWCKRKKLVKYIPEFEIPEWIRKERKPLTDEEVKRIFTHIDGNITLYCMMYLFMGVRSGEITGLEWSRVDFDLSTVEFKRINTKTKLPRVIPINALVLNLLKKRKQTSKSTFVFPNQRGPDRPMSNGGFRSQWKKLLELAEIKRKITPHDLRATWETHSHLNPNFTDTQREKMAGAKIDVQKDIYVKLAANKLKGLENVVQVKGLDKILKSKFGGNAGGRKPINKAKEGSKQ